MHGFKKIKFLFSKKKSEKKSENKPDWNLHLPVIEKFKKVFGDVRNGKPLVLFIKEILLDSTFKDLLYPAAKHQDLEKYIDAFNELVKWEYWEKEIRSEVLLTDIAKFDEKFAPVLSSSKFDSVISASKSASALSAPKFLEGIREIVAKYSKKAVPNLADDISYEALKYRLAHWGVEKQIKIQWKDNKAPNYSEELSILVPAKLGELAFIVREITLPEVKILQQLVQEEHYRNLVLAFMLKQKIYEGGRDGLSLTKVIFRSNSPLLDKYYYMIAQKEFSEVNIDALKFLRKPAAKGEMTENEKNYFYERFVGPGGKEKKSIVFEENNKANISEKERKPFEELVKDKPGKVLFKEKAVKNMLKSIDENCGDTMARAIKSKSIVEAVKEDDELKEMILHELF